MTNDEIYYNSFPYLLHKITANLRYIFLEISREKKQIIVVGYYANDVSEIEKELLEDVSDGIASMIEEDIVVTTSFVVSQDEFSLDMHSKYLLYARYENF